MVFSVSCAYGGVGDSYDGPGQVRNEAAAVVLGRVTPLKVFDVVGGFVCLYIYLWPGDIGRKNFQKS